MRPILFIKNGTLFFLFFSFLATTSYAGDQNIKDAVVKIYSVYKRYNYHEPWQMLGQSSRQGSGSIIDGNRILTNAHIVSDQTFIQVRRAGQARKYTAKVDIIAHESDLAILRVSDKTFFSGVTPLEIGDLPEIKDKSYVYGFPDGGDKLSITEGVVSRVEHTEYAHSQAYLLTCQIDAAINGGNSGGPVIKEGKLIGVAFQSFSGNDYENIGYMVPAPVVRHFLKDIEDGVHDGTPDLGITMQHLENPDMRDKFFMKERETGVLVNKVYPDSPAEGLLFSEDIILAIDGKTVANDGTIEFRKGERTFFGFQLQKKQINDSVTLKVLRNNNRRVLSIKLKQPINFERLVPYKKFDTPPTYFITGGFVFEGLTLNYLEEYDGGGAPWYLQAPRELVREYFFGEPEPDRREVVVLVKVLADEINIGYHNSGDMIITKVNGKKISTLKELIRGVETGGGDYLVFEGNHGLKLILARSSIKKAGQGILKKYQTGSDRSKDLL